MGPQQEWATTPIKSSSVPSPLPSRLATMDGMSAEEGSGEDYRRHLYDALHAASRDYDQAILTLAAGTLGLSVTFLHDITPTPVGSTRLLVIGAWGSLGAALIAIVLSFLTSQWVLRRRIAAIDDKSQTPSPLGDRVTGILNGLAGLGLIAGLVLLGLYALENS
jgi:hypothetical protein